MLSSQEDEPQDPTLYCMLVRNICSEFNLYSGLYTTKAPQVDPGCTWHVVAQSNQHCIWFALAASVKLHPAHTDKLWGEPGEAGFCSFAQRAPVSHSSIPLPPTSFNSLTTPWHLRVPGIRLKWERGHKLWFPAQIPHNPIKCMQVWSEPKEFLSTKR